MSPVSLTSALGETFSERDVDDATQSLSTRSYSWYNGLKLFINRSFKLFYRKRKERPEKTRKKLLKIVL